MRELREESRKPSDNSLFGKWFTNMCITNKVKAIEVARELRTSRQSISNYVCKRSKPPYTMIVALCWLFEEENPEEIWKLVEADWGD